MWPNIIYLQNLILYDVSVEFATKEVYFNFYFPNWNLLDMERKHKNMHVGDHSQIGYAISHTY